MSEKSYWILSWVVSLTLFILMYCQWDDYGADYCPAEGQLFTQATVEEYLSNADHMPAEPSLIPTGAFLQSLDFNTYSTAYVTGYIWQRFTKGEHMIPAEKPGNATFILPEAVETGVNIEPQETYRRETEEHVVIGWYFEATLRQPFDYDKYPFDHKTVWIRMWPKDFDQNVVLVPDLTAYDDTGEGVAFGLDGDVAGTGWSIDETYFSYGEAVYDTDFGIRNYAGQRQFPELYFNVVIKRRFLNAFIVNMLPVLVVLALLFATLLALSRHPERSQRFGSTLSSVLSTCAALFFVIMIAHIGVRRRLGGTGIVYIECFFLIVYVVILAVAVHSYMFTLDRGGPLICGRDGLFPKLIFWPVTFTMSLLCTITWL